uniref:Uncharacterized protein n=1 Tax=Canis lupus dingo TaxID=286419 RepID=A0A8C0JJI9_CANLU
MAADGDLEMEDVNLNMGRDTKGELEEEKEMQEDWRSKDRFKNKKVHRVVSNGCFLKRSEEHTWREPTCFPPPIFIISISLAEDFLNTMRTKQNQMPGADVRW